MLSLLRPLIDRLGLNADIDDTAIRLFDRGEAVCTPAAIMRHREAGWTVVPLPASFPDLIGVLFAGTPHAADPGIVAKAVTSIIMGFGVNEQPQVGSNGRLLRWDDADVLIVAAGKPPSGLGDVKILSVAGPVPRAMQNLRTAALTILAAGSRHEASNPSSHEARLAKALLAAGLPPAVRDLKLRRNNGRGSVYSQPDFAWPEVKLLLDVDGWYFHAAQALDILLSGSDADTARKALLAADRTRVEKDAVKRRQAAVDGWTVLTCTDTEIDRNGTERIATHVATVYRRLAAGCPG